jgi:CDP-diacylglycerol--serine O-phosphatidyltransferase
MMPQINIRQRLIDPRSPEGRPRKAAYALPTLFTAGNLFLGYLAILKAFQGAMLATSGSLGFNRHFEIAAVAIGVAVFLDGLDGRIARLTNTVSDFGRELDSLADVIAFGVAPAVLAWAWGFQFADGGLTPEIRDHLMRAGYFLAFLYVLCGAARLARFNITTDPRPKNPGRPGRKYFVGLPIPAAAGMVGSVVYAANSTPITFWPFSVLFLAMIAMLSILMISSWRYRSFKDFNLLSPRSPWSVIRFGCFIYLLWNYSQIVLLGISVAYVSSGIIVRVGGIVKRRIRQTPPPKEVDAEAH